MVVRHSGVADDEDDDDDAVGGDAMSMMIRVAVTRTGRC